jgi:hypothetical protein
MPHEEGHVAETPDQELISPSGNRIDLAVDNFARFVGGQNVGTESDLSIFKEKYKPLVTSRLTDEAEIAAFETKFEERYGSVNKFSDLVTSDGARRERKSKIAKSNLKRRGSALGFGVDQAQSLGGSAVKTVGDLFGSDFLTDFGDDIIKQQEKDIEEIGYVSKYQDSFRNTVSNQGALASLGWIWEASLENAATSGVALAGTGLAIATAPISATLATIIGVGTAGATAALGVGEVRQELEDKGVYDPDDAAFAVGAGLVIALLDRLGAKKVLPTGEMVKRLAESGVIKRIGVKAAGIATKTGAEISTEALQEAIAVGAAAFKGAEYEGSEVLDRLIDAGVVGGALGLGASTTDAAVRRPQTQADTPEGVDQKAELAKTVTETVQEVTADAELTGDVPLQGVPEEDIEVVDVTGDPTTLPEANVTATAMDTPDFGEGQPRSSEEIPLGEKIENTTLDENVVANPQPPQDLKLTQKARRVFTQFLHPSSLFSQIEGGSALLDIRRSIIGAEHDMEIESSLSASNYAQSISEKAGVPYAEIPAEERESIYRQMTGDTPIQEKYADVITFARNKVDVFSENIVRSLDNAIEFANRRGLDAEKTVNNLENAKAAVETNLGSYLNRSFQVFENRFLLRKFIGSEKHTKAVDQANESLFNGQDRDAAEAVVNDFTRDVQEARSSESFLINSIAQVYGGRVKFQTIFREKKELDPWVKTILHEDTDPVSVLNKTLGKQGFFFENMNGQVKLMDALFDAGLASAVAAPGFVPAENSMAQGKRFSLLSDVFLHKDVKDSLDALYGGGDISSGAAAFNMVNLAQKVNATVLSTSTQARNAKGAIIYALMNGASNPKDWINTYRQFRNFAKEKNQGRYDQFKKFLVRERIISDSAHADEIRDLALTIKDSDISGVFAKEFTSKVAGGIFDGAKRVFGAFSKTYRLADEFSKVIYFNKELRFGVEKMNLTNQGAMERAAVLTRRVMPTATNTPALVNRLRRPRSGVEVVASMAGGTFLTFNAEIARNVSNIYLQSKSEITSGDPVQIKRGLERFSSLAIVGSLLVQTALPEDDELNPMEVNRVLPWYYAGRELRGGELDPNGDVRFKVTHYSNPISMFTNTLRILGESIFNDSLTPEETMKFIYESTLGEFIGDNMTSQNVRELFTVDGERKTYNEAFARVLSNILPRTMTDSMKIATGISAVQTPAQKKDLENRLLKLVDAGDFILTKADAAGNAGRYLRVYKTDLNKFINNSLLTTSANFNADSMAVRYVNQAKTYLDKSKETISQLVQYQQFLKVNGIEYSDKEMYSNFKGASGMSKGMFTAITKGIREDTLDEITPFSSFGTRRSRSKLIDAKVMSRRAASGKVEDPDLLPVFEEREAELAESIARLQFKSGTRSRRVRTNALGEIIQ